MSLFATHRASRKTAVEEVGVELGEFRRGRLGGQGGKLIAGGRRDAPGRDVETSEAGSRCGRGAEAVI